MNRIAIFTILITANILSYNYILNVGFNAIGNDFTAQLSFFIMLMSAITFHFTMEFMKSDLIKIRNVIKNFYNRQF